MIPLIVPCLSFLLAYGSEISAWLGKYLIRDSPEVRALQAEVDQLQRELAKISMRDNYIEYVKMDRRVLATKTKMNEARGRKTVHSLITNAAVYSGISALPALALVVISIAYRYTPVVVFGDNFNFDPLGRVLAFPTGVPNAVSMVAWILMCNFVAKTVKGYHRRAGQVWTVDKFLPLLVS